MVKDRDDLIGAIAKLRSGIQSLNKEGRTRLTEAFDVVNGHFKELFTSLFGGGTAELQFVESDDPLEAGPEHHRAAARQEAFDHGDASLGR